MSLPKLNPVEPPWYGPVCPVVGEGWHREVSPYPDLLRVSEFRRPAHVLPALLRPAAAFGGAGPDQVALHVSKASEDRDHQAPGAGGGVGPRLGGYGYAHNRI